MTGEVIHLPDANSKKFEANVSVNTQAVAAIVVMGLFMLGTRSSLRTVIANQKVIYEGVLAANESVAKLAREAVTVRDVVQLAAKATESTLKAA